MGKQDEYLKVLQMNTTISYVSWWPKFVYHFTDISNAVQIINDGMLFARGNLLNHMYNDNASSEIINITNTDIKNYVRFYFRPKTPTQYHNEGYKPVDCRNQKYKDADIPVPIFFVFEACEMLSLPYALYSEKSLASPQSELINDIESFKKFDFYKIYSGGPYQKKDIKLYRHAELVVPNQCDLKYLKQIWCRSQAEYQTFCYMLKKAGKLKEFKNIIGVKSNDDLFYKRSLFVSRVTLTKADIVIFIDNTNIFNSVETVMKVVINIGGKQYLVKHIVREPSLKITLEGNDVVNDLTNNNHSYVIDIFLDTILVYSNEYIDNELPY